MASDLSFVFEKEVVFLSCAAAIAPPEDGSAQLLRMLPSESGEVSVGAGRRHGLG